MELEYSFVIYLSVILCALLFFIKEKKKVEYKDGKKLSSSFLVEDDPYFKQRFRRYRILKLMIQIFCFFGIIASSFLIARPYSTDVEISENHSRDIMLCIDGSQSVDELNLKLVGKLQETVKSLKGERFGIVIFNTSPVMLSPLTSDYDYISDVLSKLEKSLKVEINQTFEEEDALYLNSYLLTGTLIGSEERGSSLIGDGLAASAYDFQNLEEDRTRIIIFSTDNDLQGEPLVTLNDAASICKKKNIIVFGIGTKEMTEENKASMKAAVEKTGGKFYLEEDSGTVKEIVKSIEKEEKSLIKEGTEIRKVEQPAIPFLALLLAVSMLLITGKISKL